MLEAAATAGGGLRTQELIEAGTRHDVCSAIHPLGLASRALRDLPLGEYGLEWVWPDIEVANVVDGGAGLLYRDLDATAAALGADGARWRDAMRPLLAGG